MISGGVPAAPAAASEASLSLALRSAGDGSGTARFPHAQAPLPGVLLGWGLHSVRIAGAEDNRPRPGFFT